MSVCYYILFVKCNLLIRLMINFITIFKQKECNCAIIKTLCKIMEKMALKTSYIDIFWFSSTAGGRLS
jgi:hypothetical protein